MSSLEPVIAIQNAAGWIGTYALRIQLGEPLNVRIGRINRGEPVCFPAGDYLYIGSALGAAGALALPRRLIRHATRSAARPEHCIRSMLHDHFASAGLNVTQLTLKAPKRLRWNIDHLLDHLGVELVQVFYIRSPLRLEHALVIRLEQDQEASAIIPGFGAHDHPGHAHLFLVPALEPWHAAWRQTLQAAAVA